MRFFMSEISRMCAGATLISFLAALVHFSLELLVFKTMSLKSAANPLIIAGGSKHEEQISAMFFNAADIQLTKYVMTW